MDPYSDKRYLMARQTRVSTFGRYRRLLIIFCFISYSILLMMISTRHENVGRLRPFSDKLVAKLWGDENAVSWNLSDRPYNVAVLEGGGYHDEVVLSLAAALSKNPDIVTDIYTWEARFGSRDILKDIAKDGVGKMRLYDSGAFVREQFDFKHKASHVPEVVIAVTCRRDLLLKGGALDYLLYHTDAVLWCVVHHSDKWEDKTSVHARLISSWRRRNRVKFLTLSPHVLSAMRKTSAFKGSDIEVFTPIFGLPARYNLPSEDELILKDTGIQYLTLQGNFEPDRRNYTATFEYFQQYFVNDPSLQDRYRLVLLGHGNVPTVPDALEGKVLIRSGLDYQQYYALLRESKTLLTAFAHPKYLSTTASSTVAASMIVGVPLIADPNILAAYSYLQKGDVIFRSTEEEELVAARRFVGLSPLEQSRIYRNIFFSQSRILEENSKRVKMWTADARRAAAEAAAAAAAAAVAAAEVTI